MKTVKLIIAAVFVFIGSACTSEIAQPPLADLDGTIAGFRPSAPAAAVVRFTGAKMTDDETARLRQYMIEPVLSYYAPVATITVDVPETNGKSYQVTVQRVGEQGTHSFPYGWRGCHACIWWQPTECPELSVRDIPVADCLPAAFVRDYPAIVECVDGTSVACWKRIP